jgi:hypothetical protein
MPSSFRKSSKLRPVWGLTLVALAIDPLLQAFGRQFNIGGVCLLGQYTAPLTCPLGHKAFKIGDAGYADILKQLRGGNFEKQLHERLELAEREKRDAIAVAEANVTNALQKTAAASASSHQPIQILISPHHPYLAQRMAVRQVAQHLHRLRLRLLAGKAQQGAVGFRV